MAFLPSIFERKWPSVILSPITVASHIITVSDTAGLHSKQEVTLRLGGNAETFEIKRVLSDTQLQVGLVGKDMAKYANPIAFNGGTLEMSEQNRNPMGWEIVGRAVYQEEPAVALRTVFVNEYGEFVDTIKDPSGITRLAVDTSLNVDNLNVNIENPTTPLIYTLSMPLADTEYSLVIPAKTNNFMIRERDSKGPLRLKNVTAGSFYTITRGSSYKSDPIDRITPLTMYIESAQAGSIVEVFAWIYP